LERYEAACGIKPEAPLPLATFVAYGRWFRQHLDSDLDTRLVAQVAQEHNGFRLTLEDGEVIRAARVVVAAGIGPFPRKPAEFANLPEKLVSHCYEGRKVREFSGERVAVVGAGQSALESAALLSEAGADVEVIARISELRWIGMHSWLHHLGLISKMLYSKHDIGPLGISRLVAAPNLVRRIPLQMRDKIRKRAVRAAGSPWLPARLTSVKLTTGRRVTASALVGTDIQLRLDDGTERRVDHILLGTGYDVNISRYAFLSPELVKSVGQLDGYPALTGGFASSVPGLHFIGAAAARSFGPLLYFVTGTDFASHELASHISK
jgi:cation diffusion facilitator CzcD-associated flavoprotein CzcO